MGGYLPALRRRDTIDSFAALRLRVNPIFSDIRDRTPAREDENPPAAAEPLDPEFVRMIQESLDDPRPSIPVEEVFAELKARHEARLKHEVAKDPADEQRELLKLIEDLEAVGSPGEVEIRDPFEFPDRPGLY